MSFVCIHRPERGNVKPNYDVSAFQGCIQSLGFSCLLVVVVTDWTGHVWHIESETELATGITERG